MKLLHVESAIRDRKGNVISEPMRDGHGNIILRDGSAKRLDQLRTEDEWQTEPVTIGAAINAALERDDKELTGEEKRRRFRLMLRIQDAIDEARPLEISEDDADRIRKATEHLAPVFVGRIDEALAGAEPAHKVHRKKDAA